MTQEEAITKADKYKYLIGETVKNNDTNLLFVIRAVITNCECPPEWTVDCSLYQNNLPAFQIGLNDLLANYMLLEH